MTTTTGRDPAPDPDPTNRGDPVTATYTHVYPTREEWEANAASTAAYQFDYDGDWHRKGSSAYDARLADFAPTEPDEYYEFHGKTPMELLAARVRRHRTELTRFIKKVESGEATFWEWDRAGLTLRCAVSGPEPWFEAAQADVAAAKAEAVRRVVEYRSTDEAWAKELAQRERVEAYLAGPKVFPVTSPKERP